MARSRSCTALPGLQALTIPWRIPLSDPRPFKYIHILAHTHALLPPGHAGGHSACLCAGAGRIWRNKHAHRLHPRRTATISPRFTSCGGRMTRQGAFFWSYGEPGHIRRGAAHSQHAGAQEPREAEHIGLIVDIKKRLVVPSAFPLQLEAGRGVTGILGSSGCEAKSNDHTSASPGIEQPDSGHIELDSVVTRQQAHRPSPPAAQVGYLFQNYALFPNMTLRQNILCGLKNQPDEGSAGKEAG